MDDDFPLSPKQTRDLYGVKGKPVELSDKELREMMVFALENCAHWWAKRGGTPVMISDSIMPLVKECGKPAFVTAIEVRRIAARAFRRVIREQASLVAQLREDSVVKTTNIGEELDAMEGWLEYRTEQFHFGIRELDEAIGGGIMKGQMMSIIGNPGSMKTSLLLNGIEQWVTESEEPISFFSLDMNKAAVFERLMLRELRCGPDILREHQARRSVEYMAAKQAIGKRYSGKLNVYENSSGDKWTIDKVLEHVETMTPGLVCIDFLTQLKKPRQSTLQLIEEAAPMLKDIAHDYGCAVVVLSQMSQASRNIQASGGMGGSAKGGPTVEENADIEMELFRDVAPEGGDALPRIVATIKKTRRGVAGGSFQLFYSGPLMEFKDYAQLVPRSRRIKPVFETA